MAAAYLFHLCQNHAFIDGNKRVGANAAITFLLMNNWHAFVARALRSISGRVLISDTHQLRYVPVIGAEVRLNPPRSTAKADPQGRYLFRDLAAGSYTLSVRNEAQTPARTVRLGSQTIDFDERGFSHQPVWREGRAIPGSDRGID